MSQLRSMFRGQLVYDDQVALYDYWRSKCHSGHLPGRQDIRPAEFARFLPQVSLLDVSGEGDQLSFRYRLAGTGLCTRTGKELTGKHLEELFSPAVADYWQRVLCGLVERKRPACGGVRRNAQSMDPFAQFWLRLPLADETGAVSTILGLDLFVPISNLSHDSLQQLAFA